MHTAFAAFALSVGLLLPSAALRAEPLLDSHHAVLNSGHTLYQTYCAQCHGADGKGGATDSLRATVKVPDLTTIAQRNDGVFPVGKVYDMISGSELLPAHGTRLMPEETVDLFQAGNMDWDTLNNAEPFIGKLGDFNRETLMVDAGFAKADVIHTHPTGFPFPLFGARKAG